MNKIISNQGVFSKTLLATFISVFVNQSVFALQELSDNSLSETTGEGVAFLPQDAYMIFRGEGPNESTANLTDRSKDTGYINYIPVGPLSTTAADTNKNGSIDAGDQAVGKADLFLYGLAISKADGNSNNRVGLVTNNGVTSVNKIGSWGTATNPWLFKVNTTTESIPDFNTTGGAGNTSGKPMTYLALEAPLYEYTYEGTTTPTQKTAPDPLGIDAYKLKLGLWADAFVRNPYLADGDPNQFNYGTATGTRGSNPATAFDATRANRLRLQAIIDGFSMNGSQVRLFQTQNGASNSNGMSSFYNNTLGMSGVLRFNSGDSAKLLATETTGTVTKTQSTTNRYSTVYTGQSGSSSSTYDPNSDAAKYRIRTQDTVYVNTGASWTAPANLNDHVFRLSTRETTDTANLTTPAINSGTAPVFDANEGVFIYNLNANLVLGNLYQPLIVGSDGKNFSLEIARIPNKESIYKKIYTNYDNFDPATNGGYYGSTCNVYQCGTSSIAGYQGASATHSSISIGTVYSPDGGKTLQANKSSGAVGISFGKLQNNTIAASTQYYYQLQKQERRKGTSAWEYLQTDGTWKSGTSGCSGAVDSGACYNDFNNAPWINVASFNNACVANTITGCSGAATAQIKNGNTAVDLGYAPNVVHNGYTVGSGLGKMGWGTDNGYRSDVKFPASAQFVVPTWGGGAQGSTPAQSVLNAYGAQYSGTTWTSTIDPTPNIPVGTSTLSASPTNNFGSAAIDGLLIQHMKITTKGL